MAGVRMQCLPLNILHEAETHSYNCQQCYLGPITMLWARWGRGHIQ